ncbi:MAG: Tim44 domain-containing protein [Hydrogenophaga sp.]|nr:Tim44 domain-containing protein [Hydrogenophaga sp.]
MTLGLGTFHIDAEAKRIGGGRSFGMQRQATPPARAPQATPSTAPAAGAAGAAAAPKRNWMGPIAGLAAGLGLAALASHLGFGEGFANLLMIGLLVMAAVAAFRFFGSRRQGSQGMTYAGAGAGAGNPSTASFRTADAGAAGAGMSGGSMIGANLREAQPRIPADFDTAGFERQAKVNYIRLQAANDAGNLEDIRQFTTPEMFAEIQMDLRDRQGATQHTDVMQLHAQVMEVVEDGALYVASVRFIGEVREDGVTGPIDEVWHLTKPRQGGGGWVLAGIQQSN